MSSFRELEILETYESVIIFALNQGMEDCMLFLNMWQGKDWMAISEYFPKFDASKVKYILENDMP